MAPVACVKTLVISGFAIERSFRDRALQVMASFLSDYYAAVDKTIGETIAVSESAVGVLADAATKTGRDRSDFEVHQISREKYERG